MAKVHAPAIHETEHMHSFSITFEAGIYWKVTASGSMTRDTGWLVRRDILDLLNQRSSVRLLVDLRATVGRPDIVTSILQAEMLAQQPIMFTHRIAVVDLEENRKWMTDEMLCFSNRGLPIRFFLSEEDATHWLSA
jgi:hypothetical protein